MKKRGIRKQLLLAKTRTARRSCWVKNGRTNAWWENFITNKVPESEWKDNFRMSRKCFYELNDYVETISTEKTYPSEHSNICRGTSRLILAEKPRMLSEFLEHPFPELSEEYPMLSQQL